MQRRKFLIGAGSFAAATAGAIGTGAFTSVEAERDVTITTVGDASAYLGIEAMDTPNGNEYVVNDGGGVVGLEFSNVNKNADSKFSYLLEITNNGTQDVYVGADDSGIQDIGVGIFCEGAPDDGDAFPRPKNQPGSNIDSDNDIEKGAAFEYPEDPVVISPGDTCPGVGIAWDRGSIDFSSFDGTYDLIIQAQDVDNYQSSP